MKLLTKSELNTQFGNHLSEDEATLVHKVAYLSGIQPFDELLDGKTLADWGDIVVLNVRASGLGITWSRLLLKNRRVAIRTDRIVGIHLENKEQIFQTKEQSVVGRAWLEQKVGWSGRCDSRGDDWNG